MGFYLWTCLGLAIAVVHLIIPGQHRVGAASAMMLGVGGAWNGALVAAAFVRGGWASFPPLAIGGAILGAVGAIASMEIIAERYLEGERRADAGAADPGGRARLRG